MIPYIELNYANSKKRVKMISVGTGVRKLLSNETEHLAQVFPANRINKLLAVNAAGVHEIIPTADTEHATV